VKRLAPILVLLFLASQDAQGFSVSTGFTDPCHERFAMAAIAQARVIVPLELMPEPPTGTWETFFNHLIEDLGYVSQGRREDFFFFSILAGVRANDTDGHSALNLNALRSLHVHPELQYEHFLRAQDDDHEEGNTIALENSRQQLLDFFTLIQEYLDMDPEDQIISVIVTVDFHGEVDVDAWAPAFYLGKALHTMADSFSHTIRTDDMSKIIHVLNYAEAVSGKWSEERDGLRHSSSMDECTEAMGPVLEGVLQSSVDLVFAAMAVLEGEDENLVGVHAVMDKWLTFEPGCNLQNNYCGSQWAKRAKDDPTLPYIESIFGCSCQTESGSPALLLLFLLLTAFRKR
jgi:MYXO-CTERM domain-containing protein